jgi:hypothetical protein
MARIAILTSTAPLRKTSSVHGVTKQRLNLQAAIELAGRFDMIVLGSLTADEVYAHFAAILPREVRPKFRLYPRSFFHGFRTQEVLRTTDDPRNAGWQQILSENGIEFEVLRSRVGADQRHVQKKFSWEELGHFITDARVTLVTGGEGQLFYEAPAQEL